MTFSLAVATLGIDKRSCIEELLESLNRQQFQDFEVILIDQNAGNEIKEVVENGRWSFKIVYLRSAPGLSKARNVGLLAAKGEYISFPDDDCLYPPELLAEVNSFLRDNPEIDLLAIDTRDPVTNKKLPYTKKVSGQFMMSKNDIFKTITSISIFGKNFGDINFDERLGLGTEFPSCEEFDFVTQYFKRGSACYFSDAYFVYHPDHSELKTGELIKKIKKHGLGHGAYFKKHLFFIFPTAFYFIIVAPIGGLLLGMLKLDQKKMAIYWAFLITRFKGFIKF